MFYKIKLKIFQKKFRRQNMQNDLSIKDFCDVNKIIAGKKSYGTISLQDSSDSNTKLYIGNYCSIADNVEFLLGGEHNTDTISTYPFKVQNFGFDREAKSKGDIIIKDDVWIGKNAIIFSGITIGQGAVIAAGAIVTKDVEPYSIVGGIPAKHIKYRFNNNIIKKLVSINITELFDKFNKKDMDLIYTKLDDNVLNKILKRYKFD